MLKPVFNTVYYLAFFGLRQEPIRRKTNLDNTQKRFHKTNIIVCISKYFIYLSEPSDSPEFVVSRAFEPVFGPGEVKGELYAIGPSNSKIYVRDLRNQFGRPPFSI